MVFNKSHHVFTEVIYSISFIELVNICGVLHTFKIFSLTGNSYRDFFLGYILILLVNNFYFKSGKRFVRIIKDLENQSRGDRYEFIVLFGSFLTLIFWTIYFTLN
ncbi:hypothetical protein GCM10027189_20180 [Rufibacter soli]